MKTNITDIKFIIFLFMLTAILTYSNNAETVITDYRLEKILKEFKKDAKRANIDIEDRLSTIDTISFRRLESNIAGRVLKEKNVITITMHPTLIDYPLALRRTVYHELGHIIGLTHCHYECNHIMSAFMPTRFLYEAHDWERDKEHFFNKLNNQ